MKSVVLLSGGLDSSVNLAVAASNTEVTAALTFDYGQKAAAREIESSNAMAARYGITHIVINLDFLAAPGNALTGDMPIPQLSEIDLDDTKATAAAANLVWVPNRNGVFVNAGAALAEILGASVVVAGFNAEEAATFPDNGLDFYRASNQALHFSTSGRVALKSYTLDLSKADIVKLGLTSGAPLDLVWACYSGSELMCGKCESCRRLKRAAGLAGANNLFEGRFSS